MLPTLPVDARKRILPLQSSNEVQPERFQSNESNSVVKEFDRLTGTSVEDPV